jgi:hypothetical protein
MEQMSARKAKPISLPPVAVEPLTQSTSRLTLRCYTCGRRIVDGSFILASPAKETDRAFSVHPACAKVLDEHNFVLLANPAAANIPRTPQEVAQYLIEKLLADWSDQIRATTFTQDEVYDFACSVVGHIDTAYPNMWQGVPKLARTSIRNHIINQLRPLTSK